MEKEFLYVGHYIDTDGNYILKIGTTNDLRRRAAEQRVDAVALGRNLNIFAFAKCFYRFHVILTT